MAENKTTSEGVVKKRAYHSPRRQEQANVTKSRIVAAAMQLVKEKGYADMTLESIAREAGVAPQTVYAVCGSKKGVLAAILETTVEAKQYDKLRDAIPNIQDPRERVDAMAQFHVSLCEGALPVFDIMRGMSVLSPEFADQEYDQSIMLFEKSRGSVQKLAEQGLLRPGLSVERAAEIYFGLSAPGVHRRFVKMMGWSPEEYSRLFSYMLSVLLLGQHEGMPFLNEGELDHNELRKVAPSVALHDELMKGAKKKRVTRKKAVEPAESAAAEEASANEAAAAVKVRRRVKAQD